MPRTQSRYRTARSTRTGRRRRRAVTTMRRSNYGTQLIDTIKRHAPTLLKFAYSYYCKQPMPDRYDVWLHYSNYGSYAAGVTTGSFAFAINDIVFPLNKPGALTTLPNAGTAVSTTEACGLKNLLLNTATNTGFYTSYVVLGAKVEVSLMPQQSGDTLMTAMAPVLGAGVGHTDVIRCAQSPNGVSKTAEFSVAARENMLSAYWSMPGLFGKTYAEHIANEGVAGSFATNPTSPAFGEVLFATQDKAATGLPVTVKIQLATHVLFFNRVDVSLLDN